MHRYARSSSFKREALGKHFGRGRRTFYAQFKRHKLPDYGTSPGKGHWVLLTTVTDEDCLLLADHLWAVLPPSTRYCSWALEPRTLLRLEAKVGTYETRRYDPRLCKSVGLTDYCFEVIFDYEPVKHFPVLTPRFERDCEAFFNKLLIQPDLVKRWSRSPSLVGLPEKVFPSSFLL